ncbi:MAG: gene transfer agent family protein [Halocynthiibacter sp.]
MENPWAGEVILTLDGVPHVLKLTLGALAELEATLKEDSLMALIERFETQSFSSADVMRLLVAGLRGGGWSGTDVDFLTVEIEGGPLGAARVAALLLARAFMMPEGQNGGADG